MLAAAMGVYFVARRHNANHISGFNQLVIKAWGWIAGAIFVNAGWYALSRHLAEPGERWNATMFEWRWLMALSTSAAFAYGMLSFVRLIEDFSVTVQWSMFTILVATAFALGVY